MAVVQRIKRHRSFTAKQKMKLMDARPGLSHHIATALVTLFIFEQHSRLPEVSFLACVFVFPVIVGILIAYCVAFNCQRRLKAKSQDRKSKIPWGVFPLALLLISSSAATHWPASVRFQVSKTAFEQLVDDAYDGRKPEGFPKRVGLYWIESVQDTGFNYTRGTGTIGFVTGTALIDECGFEFNKADPPALGYLRTRIAPCWYLTEW